MSYSRLSDYDRNGAAALLEKQDKGGNAVRKGSLINDLLFQNVEFDSTYMMKLYEKPTATLLKLADIIIKNYVDIPDIPGIIEIIKNNNFWSITKSEEILIEKFDKPEFWEYLKIEMNTDGRVPITPSMKIEADEIVHTLRTHKYSRKLFNTKHIDIHSEIKFQIEYRGVLLRGIVDMIEINHKNKTFGIIDLKTGGDVASEFTRSFVKWRYDLQEAVYMLAVEHIREQLGFTEYKIIPFRFLYIGLREKLPVIFKVSEKWHNGALHGFKTESGFEYKGLNQLIDEVVFHWTNKIYDIPYEILKNNGRIELNSNFITVEND